MPVTPMFAAIFGLIYVVLSIGVIRIRIGGQVSLGTGENPDLEKAVRIHGNFAEFVPLGLLLLWFLETISLSSNLVFSLGVIFLIARIAHVIGMRHPKRLMVLRQIGVVGTLMVIAIAALNLLWWYLPVSL